MLKPLQPVSPNKLVAFANRLASVELSFASVLAAQIRRTMQELSDSELEGSGAHNTREFG